MTENNPLVLYQHLRDTLRRYIPTTLPISRNYPELKKAFQAVLNNQELVKGPYIEALPDFEKGNTLRSLLSESGGFLHNGFAQLPESLLDRALHAHQQEALMASCRDKQSLLVATGTGSGKTECFLYPLAHQLLNDPEPDAPGVRCLLIYPMNALANDQLYYRIAPLFGLQLAEQQISFGRFTSQIRANTSREEEESRLRDNDKLMQALDDTIPSHWRLTREEMLEQPPKILITNYAMLEHLLLLPRNAPLFAHNTLKTIVLDEIHTYQGAQATEVAFLLRKLKNRLKITQPLQVFGTSASLPSGTESDAKIISFAKDLFGEELHRVIRGTRVPHVRLQQKGKLFSLEVQAWCCIGKVLNKMMAEDELDIREWNYLLDDEGVSDTVPELDIALSFAHALEELFANNIEIRKVSDILDNGSALEFKRLAKLIFSADDEQACAALSAIIHIGMLAKADGNGFPLLPGRYHIATNSIEGISVRPSASQKEGWSDIKAYRFYQDAQAIYYPMLVCRKCGQPYMEGFKYSGKLHNRMPALGSGSAQRMLFWLGEPLRQGTVDEDDDDIDLVESDADDKHIDIDPITGELSAEGATHIRLYPIESKSDKETGRRYVSRCPACSGSSGMAGVEVMTRMHPGNEALGSVVLQQLLESLPASYDNAYPKPMGGRSLLTFSDNRQDAAFFAPYFERTNADLALRSALIQIMRKNSDERMDLEWLFDDVYKHWKKQGLPVMINHQGQLIQEKSRMRDLLMGRIAAEFFTPSGRRNSLESLGLVRVEYDEKLVGRLKKEIAEAIPEAYRNDSESLIYFLLETIRREKAIADLYDLDMQNPYIWGQAYANHRSFECYKANDNIRFAWITQEGSKRHNRRTWYLVEQLAWSWDEARAFLSTFWEVLISIKLLRTISPGYGLNGQKIAFISGQHYPLYACHNCGLLQPISVSSKCTAFRCKGRVEELSQIERKSLEETNHYIYNYLNARTTTARAREHTASLSTELREEIEREFADKKINVLSCTTTMEMGVDLGDLDAVLNLNIPPNISNYQQRTGRAGRRAQAAPVCITVARSSQYDQAVFRDFKNFLSSHAAIPFIKIDNARLFRRHQNAIILSHFLRDRIKDVSINAPSLKAVFGEQFDNAAHQAFIDQLSQWLEGEGGTLALEEAESLKQHLPFTSSAIALAGKQLSSDFRSQMINFANQVNGRWSLYQTKVTEAETLREYKKVLHWQALQKRYIQQFLVNQLSQRSLIPTYSFPVHSLTLEVTKDYANSNSYGSQGDVALSRDASQGISEYAPGAEVIANGRLWKSTGLLSYPKMFMPTEWYALCRSCHHVDIGIEKQDVAIECSHCGNADKRTVGRYIKPLGFVTSYSDRHGSDPGTMRKRQRRADEAKLITKPAPEQFEETDISLIDKAILRAQPVDEEQSGKLFILNRGPYGLGYHICPLCKYSEPAQVKKPIKVIHVDPLSDKSCYAGQLPYPVELAHEFDTDVLILSFSKVLPFQADNTADSIQSFLDGFCRTLSEALRFAAASCLQIQANELRSTFRINGDQVEAILYDAVSGGAGYCSRIYADTVFKDIVKQALFTLDCPRDCVSACNSCLCDYSNQHVWDLFDRKPVIVWLQQLLSEGDADPYAVNGAIRWHNPNLQGFSERLSGYHHLHIIGKRLDVLSGVSDQVRQWIIGWLNSGKKLSIYLTEPLQISGDRNTPYMRQTIRYFYPFIKDQLLSVHFNQSRAVLPRIFTELTLGASSWVTPKSSSAILENLLAAPLYHKPINDEMLNVLNTFISGSITYPDSKFQEGQPIELWQLSAGESRDFNEIFSVLRNAYIEEIVIKDPFCGSPEWQRSHLTQFVSIIVSLADKVEKIIVHCRELHYKDANYESSYLINDSVEAALQPLIDDVSIEIHSFRDKKSFHDRSVDIRMLDADGASVLYKYDLSGGIDKLIDVNTATKVYRYEQF